MKVLLRMLVKIDGKQRPSQIDAHGDIAVASVSVEAVGPQRQRYETDVRAVHCL